MLRRGRSWGMWCRRRGRSLIGVRRGELSTGRGFRRDKVVVSMIVFKDGNESDEGRLGSESALWQSVKTCFF